ncbi:uncharacterized protein TRAVEDRAFT_156445 [Trametes versicolor FP-101664 SS1]|uniref:uncharacterized protein n=1 Tax=Trametes versicolor (strain FP-101664) TaxID=717944 RepID=UPI0004623F28|nr:uncharacterized protein TRAVEDRAFT_156445 [Trametes versicolor FP-101664 SS1]EIW52348.1 hypothetical protein TRAVEDRAFT_156445 [Trametes versicolor FP-101664 SS1]
MICSVSNSTEACVAICPNPDLAGVGVRTAFYLQSVMNTLLVILSRRDSVPSAWASTLLTASLIIAAMVQKGNQSITLHHATLTLNFATLSCISSLAVAPTLSIWRLSPESYYNRQLARHVLDTIHEDRDSPTRISSKDKAKVQKAQGKQRLFLAIALLTQVVLQWAWGVVLFVSPAYSQKNCSGGTTLIFFLASFTASEINDKYMVVWVFWLLFSLGITLGMTIMLALTSPARARLATASNSSRASSLATRSSSMASTSRHTYRSSLAELFRSMCKSFPAWKDRDGQIVFWFNVAAVVLWLVYIISAEIQIQANCIFDGENIISSFGQITALLLSMQPLWSVIVAVYRLPARQRRIERRRKREEQEQLQALDGAKAPLSPTTASLHITLPGNGPTSAPGSPVRGRSRSVLVSADRFAPTAAVVAAPNGERRVPTPASPGRRRGGMRSRAPATTTGTHAVIDVYIPRTHTEEWNELVSLTHLPRASAFSMPGNPLL